MSRIEDAVKKINLDIQKEPDNGYIAAVGEYIIDCITSEEAEIGRASCRERVCQYV